MTPRKRELLDVLRRQQQPATDDERRAPAAAAPQSARFRFRFGPSQRRAWLRVAIVLLWVVLVVWLVQLIVGGEKPAPGPSPAASPPSTPSRPESASDAAPAATARDPGYGVLAITYQGESQRDAALSLARQLKDQLVLPDVTLHEIRDSGKVFYEVYVGHAAAASALNPLCEQVRGLTLPGSAGKPFASAIVKRRPNS